MTMMIVRSKRILFEITIGSSRRRERIIAPKNAVLGGKMKNREKEKARRAELRRFDQIIRPDDYVIVNSPVVVRRVGYPLDIREVAVKLRTEHVGKITDLVKDICGYEYHNSKSFSMITGAGFSPVDDGQPSRMERNVNQIFMSLAYFYVNAKGFGGNERSLHTEEMPDLVGQRLQVEEVRIVKTGNRYASWSSGDSWDGYDYEPGGLDKEQTHKLIRVCPRYAQLTAFPRYGDPGVWVEVKNCTKIIPERGTTREQQEINERYYIREML
jgi:hypothetical protein